MNLSNNTETRNANTGATRVPFQIAIVNANATLTRIINTALSPIEQSQCLTYRWARLLDCKKTLAQCEENQTTVWILCATDDNEEILDFITYLYNEGERSILAIDARSIKMPTMWFSYFAAGVAACIVDQQAGAIADALRLLKHGRGFLQIPDGIKKPLRRRKCAYDFSDLDLQLFELLLDQQIIFDLDKTIIQHLLQIEKLLFAKFQANSFNELLPAIAERLWQRKREVITKTITAKFKISVVSTNHDLAKQIKALLLTNRQVDTITTFTSTREVLNRAIVEATPPDLVILDMALGRPWAKIQHDFKPLRHFPCKTKRLVMGYETGLHTMAMRYFKMGANGYIDANASEKMWDQAIKTLCQQEQQFWQLLQTPITAYTITDSVSKMAQELGGLFSR
jgi:DNA-binding NarL/FixJ family response regulator